MKDILFLGKTPFSLINYDYFVKLKRAGRYDFLFVFGETVMVICVFV